MIKYIFKPHLIVIFTVTLSYLAWSIPNGWISKGFTKNIEFNITIILLLLIWYILILFLSYFGFKIGNKVFLTNLILINQFENLKFYKVLSWIAWIGTGASIASIFMDIGGVFGIIEMLISFSLNKARDSLYEDYSPGILSLRYVIIIPTGWAISNSIVGRKSIYNYVNIFMFLIYSMIYGRRVEMLCVCFYAICIVYLAERKVFSKKIIYLGITILLIFLILASVLRNFNYYSSEGYDSPLTATAANMVEYLATPFQGSLAAAANIDSIIDSVPSMPFNEYFSFFYRPHDKYYFELYSYYSGIEEHLNTNSALLLIIIDYKLVGLAFFLLLVLFWSIIAGIAYRNSNTYIFLLYPIILYSFAEIWRLVLFTTGFFYINIITIIFLFIFSNIKYKSI